MSLGFGEMEMMFNLMFPVMFFLVIGVFVVALVSGLREWNHNNHQPLLTVEADVVTKRTQYHRNTGNHMGTTSYYVTFQVESGDRMEFHVSSQEYGMLVEGDHGRLNFQGSRYQGFTRT